MKYFNKGAKKTIVNSRLLAAVFCAATVIVATYVTCANLNKPSLSDHNCISAKQSADLSKIMFLATDEGLECVATYDGGKIIVYVSTTGNDQNPGTQGKPKLTVQAAIDVADSLVTQSDITAADVRVAQGAYNVDYQTGTHIIMKEGVSLYGGYSPDLTNRSVALYPTEILDTSTTGGVVGDATTFNRAVDSGSGLTAATIVDGLRITGAGGTVSVGMYNVSSSPTISNCTIDGGTASTTYGIFNSSAAPVITQNTILGGGGSSSSAGIYNADNAAPIITNNLIDGRGNGITMGIANDNSSPRIQNNTIDGGDGAIISAGIFIGSSAPTGSLPTIENNIIFTSGAGANRRCIHEGVASSDAVSLRNNDLFDCPQALYVDFVGGGGNCSFGANFNCSYPEQHALARARHLRCQWQLGWLIWAG